MERQAAGPPQAQANADDRRDLHLPETEQALREAYSAQDFVNWPVEDPAQGDT